MSSFRPEFIVHHGKSILRVDCTDLEPRDFADAVQRAQAIVTSAPPKSLRTLLILKNRIVPGAAETLARTMRGNGPYVLATAVVGTTAWNVVVAGIRAGGRDNVELFPDEGAALEWLAGR